MTETAFPEDPNAYESMSVLQWRTPLIGELTRFKPVHIHRYLPCPFESYARRRMSSLERVPI